MAKTYTTTIPIRCWKEHQCCSCGTTYSYEFVRTIKGTGGTADKASAKARAAAEKALASDTDFHPCPHCGIYQPDMIGQRRARRHSAGFWLTLIGFGVILGLCGNHVIQPNLATLVSLALGAGAALWWLGIDFHNSNSNPLANQRLAEKRIGSGKLSYQAGQRAPETQQLGRSTRSLVQQTALILALLGLGAVALPEGLRTAQAWPLNPDCYPPVVGPGDTTRIYLDQKITSIKGYWRGTPKVTIYEPGAPTNALAASATTNQNNWGDSISAKSSEKNSSSSPWVSVALSEDSALVGKPVTCDIDLLVSYPHMSGDSTFETMTRNLKRSVAVVLAPPGAGTLYSQIWWSATLLGMAFLLGAALLLIKSARNLHRLNTQTRVFTPETAAAPQG